MATFRSLSPTDVQEILAAFGAGEYRAHRPIAVGTVNTNVRVDTAVVPLFLRVNEGKSREDVEREAAIVGHVAARGVPTPPPRAHAGGRPLRRLAGRAGVAVSVGSGADAVARGGHPGARRRGGGGPRRAAPGGRRHRRPPAQSLRAGRDRRPPDARRRRWSDPSSPPRSPRWRRSWRGLQTARAAELPQGTIHGDCSSTTCCCDSERLSALIDFEQASWGRLAYDLAVTTLAFGFGRDDFRDEIVRALIDAYLAVRPATAAERAGFGAELRFAACRFAVTRITDVHLKRDAGAAPGKNFARYLARLDKVRAHLAAGDGLFALCWNPRRVPEPSRDALGRASSPSRDAL